MIISPAQTYSIWLFESVLTKGGGIPGEHLAPKNQLIPGR